MVTISESQKKFHMITEVMSLVSVPFILMAAKGCREPHGSRLKFLALMIVLVDGGLLLRWKGII